MKIVQVKVSELIFAEYNPRQLTEQQGQDLKDSIQRFGFVDPIIVNSNPDRKNIIIGGHQRARIAQILDIEKIPVHYINLNTDKEKELNIRLNKNTGEWDLDQLANHFDNSELLEWGFSEEELQFFEQGSGGKLEDEDEYTAKIEAPVYEITGDKPALKDLIDSDKQKELEKAIKASKLPKNEKDFLLKAASRHNVFKYDLIAEYYAHAEPEVQALMEQSALIVIDYEKAIENGYVVMTEEIKNQFGIDHGE